MKKWSKKEAEKLADEINSDLTILKNALTRIPAKEIRFVGSNGVNLLYKIKNMPGYVTIINGRITSIGG